MKILSRAAPLAKQTVQQEDTTAEFQAGAEQRVHRRTTVTVDRETLLILTHRSVEEAAAAQTGSAEVATETHDQLLLAAAPETSDEVSGGKS
jgi:myo-inositol catabolism protein IolC